jgi:iron uptake system component EfeO
MFSTASAVESTGTATVPGTQVNVGQGACGGGWNGGAAGGLTFALWNSSTVVQEVQIQDVDSKKIFIDVEDLGVGATRSISLALPAGSYRFLCMGGADGQPYAGPTWTLTGSYDGATTPGVLPATEGDFIGPVNDYSSWTAGQLLHLQSDAAALSRTIAKGDVTAARSAWKTAQRQYLLLGAAYDAFGDLGDAIDSPVTPGVAPLTDPNLTGLPKLEAVLWHAQPVAKPKRAGRTKAQYKKAVRAAKRAQAALTAYLKKSAQPAATELARDVAKVAQTFNNPVQPSNTDMGLRSHEILEDALRFELTGRDDAGAHLTLFDIDAMIDATRDIMAPLRGLLQQRDADLATTDAWLTRLKTYVDSFHHTSTDTWTPYQSLSVAQKRKLESILSQTLEYLSEIAVVLDPVQAGPA